MVDFLTALTVAVLLTCILVFIGVFAWLSVQVIWDCWHKDLW